MIHITPQTAAAAYELLRTTKPFAQWKLLPADEVEFKIALNKNTTEQGHYSRFVKTEHHWISINAAAISSLDLLLRVMGHEMLHLYQGIRKSETANTDHNAEFRKIGREIAEIQGWDVKAF